MFYNRRETAAKNQRSRQVVLIEDLIHVVTVWTKGCACLRFPDTTFSRFFVWQSLCELITRAYGLFRVWYEDCFFQSLKGDWEPENMMIQNLKLMGLPTKNELEEIRWELKNVANQLEELNQTVRSLVKNK